MSANTFYLGMYLVGIPLQLGLEKIGLCPKSRVASVPSFHGRLGQDIYKEVNYAAQLIMDIHDGITL